MNLGIRDLGYCPVCDGWIMGLDITVNSEMVVVPCSCKLNRSGVNEMHARMQEEVNRIFVDLKSAAES